MSVLKKLLYCNIPKQISVIRRLINEYLVTEMNKIGMKNIVPSHGDILITLFHHGELTLKQLSFKIRRDKSTVTALVHKLIKNGYLTLRPNEEDKRSKYVCLTEKANTFKEPFISISNSMNTILLQDMSEEDKKILSKYLVKIQENFLHEGEKED